MTGAEPDRPLSAAVRAPALDQVRDAELLASLSAENGAEFGALIAFIDTYSPYLRQLAAADPERLRILAGQSPARSQAAIVARQRSVGARFKAGELTRADAVRELRLNKGAQALLVALADIGEVWSVDEVTAALSEFADASVESAVLMALAELVASGKAGDFGGEPADGSGLVVLALGKHGAGELNYSSDIDLVIFYDPGAPLGASSPAPSKLYTRLAQQIAKILSERTVDGYVHRVDYRLRPDPGSTPAAVSLPAAFVYYETLGQNWERAAFIKARPVAGDLKLGRRFLEDLAPFIWRKYFDFAAIADIHAMKRQIHAVRGHDSIAVAGHDIKLGRGGIREIEFFVQTQQLVFGGRRPTLRGCRTLDMLGVLEAESWITAEARDELREAYRFLRRTEHRLQMVADEQTQRLPANPDELAAFSRFCGYPSTDAFGEALLARARLVQRHYGLLFKEGDELASDLGDLVFTGVTVDPGTVETLARLGFRDPELAAETVRGWHFGRRPAVTSARAREVLTELTPSLLTSLGGSADPDAALARLDQAFGRMPAAVELMTILRSHERLRDLFADLLGTAPRLAETVANTPHVLDALLEPGFASPPRDGATFAAELDGFVAAAADFEDFLDRVRDGARQLRFTTGSRLLSDIVTPREAGLAYGAIADAVVRACLGRVEAMFAVEHGRVPGGRLAVVGLGRLGSRDLTATSDLDLVLIYDFSEERRTSDGRRPLDAVVYYTRLAQRLVSALTAPTRRGLLYAVDLRLRPSGSKGPLATQFRGFESYHAAAAELWEHLALTRARPVAGDAALGAEISASIGRILARPREPEAVFRDVGAMRALVAKEKGEDDSWNLKLAAGGLLDVDFLAQAIVLAFAHAYPELVGADTPSAFAIARDQGLLAPDTATRLIDAHRLLDDVTQLQRLTVGEDKIGGAHDPMLKRLATLVGEPGPAELAARLDETRADVRRIFNGAVAMPPQLPASG